jgi:methane/ammonia monooxygenase subunit A
LGLFIFFFVVCGSYHIHAMLTMGDWDFWADWKDRRLWVTVTPIVLVTFPAAVQYFLWERFRQPWGATVCVLALLFGEWINRYFNFWGWTYFPVNFCIPGHPGTRCDSPRHRPVAVRQLPVHRRQLAPWAGV